MELINPQMLDAPTACAKHIFLGCCQEQRCPEKEKKISCVYKLYYLLLRHGHFWKKFQDLVSKRLRTTIIDHLKFDLITTYATNLPSVHNSAI